MRPLHAQRSSPFISNRTNRLSSYLYEITQNATYSGAAEITAEFIKAQMYNETYIIDGLDVASCQGGGNQLTYNQGFTIEGLAVYANVTGDVAWTSL